MFRRRMNVGSVRAEQAIKRAVVETLEGRQLFHDGHVHVAVGVDFQIEQTVFSQQRQHVVEKADPCLNLGDS